ncbi:MAG: TrkH family potassium uptake protein [Alkalispirochaetaceae bacterium]
MPTKRSNLLPRVLLFSVLFLGVGGLLLEQMELPAEGRQLLPDIIGYAILLTATLEVLVAYIRAPVQKNYLRRHPLSIGFFFLFLLLFLYARLGGAAARELGSLGYLSIIIIRNTLLTLKVAARLGKLSTFVRTIMDRPAQTVVLSFAVVIMVGTLLLMMPFATTDGEGLSFTESLFTATSAVCVTGLIVVDTATVFTLPGRLIILSLIQIGGLGIMILSYFTIFVIRRSITHEDTVILSYMLDEGNVDEIRAAVVRIVGFTLAIEGVGAVILAAAFLAEGMLLGEAVIFGVFHAVSAFCNAGFALFTRSFESFSGNLTVNLVVSLLIIAGGISFVVLTDLRRLVTARLDRSNRHLPGRMRPLGVGSRAVLSVTGIVLGTSFFLFYFLEHGNAMAHLTLAEQLLATFFQVVTLRTAGFNTLPFDQFATATYLGMMAFMFIGGASGSTAGGIKVNSVAVIWSYFRSVRTGGRDAVLFSRRVNRSQIASAFSVLVFGVGAIFLSTFILSISEGFSLLEVLFESVSAFGTVGLSMGITGDLSTVGRYVIIVLMFIGRVGPLTLLSASTIEEDRSFVRYPSADISVG